MSNEIALRPSYWASVSGGKDSLYMLKVILENPNKYPLDGVVHFELDIDYPFIKDVINYMEQECLRYGIKFVRIKPNKTWEELYYTKYQKNGQIYGFPTRTCRWCNSKYKMSAKKELEDFMASKGFYVISYIGYCIDEYNRYGKRNSLDKFEIYPLVQEEIYECDIWEWAKYQPIFNNFYLTNKRCGCMYCPMASFINYAYLYKYYPSNFKYMIEKMKETEKLRERQLGKPFSVISSNSKYNASYLENVIKNKWLKKLEEKELKEHINYD